MLISHKDTSIPGESPQQTVQKSYVDCFFYHFSLVDLICDCPPVTGWFSKALKNKLTGKLEVQVCWYVTVGFFPELDRWTWWMDGWMGTADALRQFAHSNQYEQIKGRSKKRDSLIWGKLSLQIYWCVYSLISFIRMSVILKSYLTWELLFLPKWNLKQSVETMKIWILCFGSDAL